MEKFKLKYILPISIFLLPTISLAAPLGGLEGLLKAIRGLLNYIVPVLFGLALIYFFWGLIQFILHEAGNEKTREEGKKKIVWGIVALFIFVSIYGILGWISKTTGIDIKSELDSSSSGFDSSESPF